jgi:cardiolipin synthase
MSHVRVAIPITKRRIQIHVDKGQPWSVVEHLILEAIARGTQFVTELESGFSVPRRVVIEALIRLMRAGWIDMRQVERQFALAVTSYGMRALERDELPSIERRINRSVIYLCDRVAGHIFRGRELRHFDERKLRERAEHEEIRWLSAGLSEGEVRYSEFAEVILDHDERWGTADLAGESSTTRYALVNVIDGVVDGLPDRELPVLRAAILAAANSTVSDAARGTGSSGPKEYDDRIAVVSSASHPVTFQSSDLLLDGDAQLQAFEEILGSAISRIIIHSTFINETVFLRFLPLMIDAVKRRGVKIDVLWGQDEEVAEPERSAAILVAKLAEDARLKAHEDRLVLHRHSTRSHAKVLLADIEREGHFVAVVGSCNWLASGYDSFEASIRLRDAALVRDVVRCLVDLAQAHSGVLTPLASDLYGIAEMLDDQPPPANSNAKASLVVSAEHNSFMLRARDEAKRRILVTSHRLGRSGRPGVLIPLIEVCKLGEVKAEARYGRLHRIYQAEQSQWTADAAAVGVNLKPVEHPRLHAKLLAWDDDSLVVSSLNWLSADPTEFNIAKELGIWIEAPGAARLVFDRFAAAAAHGGQPRS